MKVSDFLRQYQITGKVPDDADDPMIAFWAGWLMGAGRRNGEILVPLPGIPLEAQQVAMKDALDMAIHAAEFLEAHAR